MLDYKPKEELIALIQRQESELAASHDENECLKAALKQEQATIGKLTLELAARQPLADSFVAPSVTVDTPEFVAVLDAWYLNYHNPTEAYGALIAHIDAHTARAVAAAQAECAKHAEKWVSAAQPVAGELPPLPELPTHAVLYMQNGYRRAATTPRAGEPLVLKQEALNAMRVYGSLCRAAQPVHQPNVLAMSQPERIAYAKKLRLQLQAVSDAIHPSDLAQSCISKQLAPLAAKLVERVTQPVQQPAAVVGQEPVMQYGQIGDFPHQRDWYYLNAWRPTDGTKLYTAPVPAAGVQGDKQTDLSKRLREWADTRPLAAHYADIMRKGAEEIERYYNGMLNWKATAEAKDLPIQPDSGRDAALVCTCPSGDGSLRWPCSVHPPTAQTEVCCKNFPDDHKDLTITATHWSCLDCGDSWPIQPKGR